MKFNFKLIIIFGVTLLAPLIMAEEQGEADVLLHSSKTEMEAIVHAIDAGDYDIESKELDYVAKTSRSQGDGNVIQYSRGNLISGTLAVFPKGEYRLIVKYEGKIILLKIKNDSGEILTEFKSPGLDFSYDETSKENSVDLFIVKDGNFLDGLIVKNGVVTLASGRELFKRKLLIESLNGNLQKFFRELKCKRGEIKK